MEETTVPSVFDELEKEKPYFYATKSQRFLNYFIYFIIYYIFNYLVFGLIGGVMALSGSSMDAIKDFSSNKLLTYPISFVNMLIIYTLIEGSTKGRTLGKLITRTKVVKDNFSPITWKDAFIRSASRLVPFETLTGFGGYPWHDEWSKTRVIQK